MTNRKHFSSQTKIDILKKHLQKKEAISEICGEFGCAPGSVYQWQETLFSRGHQIFETKVGRPVNEKAKNERISALEEKLQNKNAVIAELMEELLKEKKLAGVI